MRTKAMAFIAKLLVLCMVVALLPTMTLAVSPTQSPTTNATYYSISLDTEADVTNGSVTYSVNNDTVTLVKDGPYGVTPGADVRVTLQANPGYSVSTDSTYKVGNDTYNFDATGVANIPATGNIVIKSVFNPTSSSNIPSGGGTVSGGSTTVEDPIASGDNTIVAAVVTPAIAGTTARATVSEGNMDKAVDSALKAADAAGANPVVQVQVDTKKAETLQLTLPSAPLKKLSADNGAILEISSEVAALDFDSTAVAAIAEEAGANLTISVGPAAQSSMTAAQKEVVGTAPVYELSITSNGKAITSFDGGILQVLVPYELPEGQNADDVAVYYLTDDAKLELCDTSYAYGIVVFTTTHLSKYVIGDTFMAPINFTDIPAGAWYADAVKYVYDNRLMKGIGGSEFAPNLVTTRAMVVTALYRIEGEPSASGNGGFADIPSGQWYTEAVAWAAAHDIVNGYSATTFAPNDAMTREQMAAILFRYAEYKGVASHTSADLSGYTDAGKISTWAKEAMEWANASKIFTGTSSTTLEPAGSFTRAQLATVLMRYYENVVK